MARTQYLFEVFDVRNAVIELVYPFKTVCRTEEEHKEKTAAFCGAVTALVASKGA